MSLEARELLGQGERVRRLVDARRRLARVASTAVMTFAPDVACAALERHLARTEKGPA